MEATKVSIDKWKDNEDVVYIYNSAIKKNEIFTVVPVIPFPHYPLPTPPWLLLDCS